MKLKSPLLVAPIIIMLLIVPIAWAIHSIITDEDHFITQTDAQDNVGYLNIINGSSAYLHNTYGTNATELLGNVTADTTTDIITSHAFLDNDQLEENSLEVIDDGGLAFWSYFSEGSGGIGAEISDSTSIKYSGSDSLNITTVAGGGSAYIIVHNYAPDADWSAYEFIALWVYGSNTGRTLQLYVRVNGWTDAYHFDTFIDNWNGWQRKVFSMNDALEVGNPSWSGVEQIRFKVFSPSVGESWFLDRVNVDVGQWVGVEISVPDTLDGQVRNVRLYAWDGSAYDSTAFMSWDAENDSPSESWDDSVLHMLDTSTIDNIYSGDIWDYMDSFLKGARFTTKDTVHVSSSNVVVYSDLKGVSYRVGFAVKMAPDDGLDSATAGISQFRFKADIYYDNNGETTVIHAGDDDSASAGYGGSIGFLIAVVIGFSVIIMGVTKKR